ncbi:MAG: glycosyltransferase family 2 protein [Muribaculaceae bacterium]|nr:glycosyltransferase family 2 protein [Muribaculaceae bacterium]
MTKKTKRIAAITMARNDEFFLNRWIKYYGGQIGKENLYIYLDGLDQKEPSDAGRANITKLPHTNMSRSAGDKYRIKLLSDLAKKLFADGYDIVIGCDADEFLIVDPDVSMSLSQYLSGLDIKTTVSGLGLDVGQHLKYETELDTNEPFLTQRSFAFLSSRYTKPVVINKPVQWGSGFHSIKGHNFKIDKNLYLLHFGAIDMNMLLTKAAARGPDWINHLKRRGNGTINLVSNKTAHGDGSLKMARIIQQIARPPYALDKPWMLGIKRVVKIPERFKKTGI